ncbi:MAG: SIR2 family protein, partial [Desulfobacterales bacterium]|nr:SIR2 family protein [Desulfobacterales bacterium]
LDQALSVIIPAGGEAGRSHLALARIVGAHGFSNVVTTNYDRLLEHAFFEHDVNYLLQVIDGNQHIREGKRPRLIKIHGDVADWKKVVLTGESYGAFKDRYGFLYNQFDILLTQNPVLFVGCSMLDDRVLDWLEALTPEDAALVQPWVALLTASQQATLKEHTRPSRPGAWEILKKIKLRVLELPDFAALPVWLETAAQEIAGVDAQRNELTLHIRSTDATAPGSWSASLDGRDIADPALPIHDEGFIKNLERLE